MKRWSRKGICFEESVDSFNSLDWHHNLAGETPFGISSHFDTIYEQIHKVYFLYKVGRL